MCVKNRLSESDKPVSQKGCVERCGENGVHVGVEECSKASELTTRLASVEGDKEFVGQL